MSRIAGGYRVIDCTGSPLWHVGDSVGLEVVPVVGSAVGAAVTGISGTPPSGIPPSGIPPSGTPIPPLTQYLYHVHEKVR